MNKSKTPNTRRLRGRLIPLSIIAAAAAAVLLLAAFLPKANREKPATPPPPVNVKVLRVEQAAVDDTLQLPGLVEPNRVVTLSAEVAGQVKDMPVREGTPVSEGEVILRLNDELIRPERDRAEATLEYWQKHYARIEDSYKQNVATDKDLDLAKMNLATAQADRDAAQARLDRTIIRAPITGVLDELRVEIGQSVNVGEPIADIVEIDPLKVIVDVPERDLPYICQQRNQEVRIFLKGPLPNDRTGQIIRIGERADPQTRTTRVEITVPNPPKPGPDGQSARGLRSGAIAKVTLMRQHIEDAIFVPLQAVIPLEQGYVVYIAANGLAHRRQVKLGLMKGTRVRVVASDNPGQGLAEGDLLIVAGHHYVAPGQAVRIVETQPSPPAQTQPANDGDARP